MPAEKIELNGKVLIARELTVKEVDKVLENLQSEEMHPFESMFPDEAVPALAMAMSLDITPDDLLDLTYSQLVTLIDEVKKKNSFLVQKVEKLAELGRKIVELDREDAEKDQPDLSKPSAATAAD